MESQAHQPFSPLFSRPCLTASVWVCLACGQISPYQGEPLHDLMNSVEGLDDPLRKSFHDIDPIIGDLHVTHAAIGNEKATAGTYARFLSEATQCESRRQKHGRVEHSRQTPPHTNYSASSDCVDTCSTDCAAGSAPLGPLIPQATSYGRRGHRQQRRPSSPSRLFTGVTDEDTTGCGDVDDTRANEKQSDSIQISAKESSAHAEGRVFGNEDLARNGAISSNRQRRAPVTTTTSDLHHLSSALGRSCDGCDTLAGNPDASVVADPPEPSELPHSLWRNAEVRSVGNPRRSPSHSTQQREASAYPQSEILIKEHLFGTREMRFCHCCREVRCAEIRTFEEVLHASLPRRDAQVAWYPKKEDNKITATAPGIVDPLHERWNNPLIFDSAPSESHCPRNESSPLECAASAAESGCCSSDTLSWSSLPPGLLALALNLARLFWNVKIFMMAIANNLNPLSPVLPKAYFRNQRGYGHDREVGTLTNNNRSSIFSSDSVLQRASPIVCRERGRLSSPNRKPRDGVGPRSGLGPHQRKSTAAFRTSRRSPSACRSADARQHLRTESPISVTEGGTTEDLNGASSGSSGHPSWLLKAREYDHAHRRGANDDPLLCEHLCADVESDAYRQRGNLQDGCSGVHERSEDILARAATGITLTAQTKRMICARKDKWNTISLSEALWRVVLPSFGAPFLSTVPTSSTDTGVATRTTVSGDGSSLDGDTSHACAVHLTDLSPRSESLDPTASNVVTGARPFSCFRGDIEEAIGQLDEAQLEVAKLRLQQVLAIVKAEQVKREISLKRKK